MRAVIFDLDQTLIDSSSSEHLRKARNWQAVYGKIPGFIYYPGMQEVMKEIKAMGLAICIITTSPGSYAKKVLAHFDIPYDHLIDFFGVKQRKPHPESFHLGMQLLQCDANAILSFGDREIDILASKAAGVASVACRWGSAELDALERCAADYYIDNPSEIIDLINRKLIV